MTASNFHNSVNTHLFLFRLLLIWSFFLPCMAWYSKRYFYEERYCLDSDGNFIGKPAETVKNYMDCPKHCARCEFMHPQNSVWCVQKHIGEPEKVYTESYQDDRLITLEPNEEVKDASCMKRQPEFTQLLHHLTGNDRVQCNMVHRDGVGHSYFYTCWTGNYRKHNLRGLQGKGNATVTTDGFSGVYGQDESYDDWIARKFDWQPLVTSSMGDSEE